jgi:hypothetical protein
MTASGSQFQFGLQPSPSSQRQQHIQAEILPSALNEPRNSRLCDSQALGRLSLRPALRLQVLFHADHHLGAQCHDLGFGWIETEIEEYISAALESAGIGESRIGLLSNDVPPMSL